MHNLVSWTFRGVLGAPGRLRLIVQPIVAILLGLRDGRADARAGRVPYVWGLLFHAGRRPRLLDALRAILVPLAVAVVIDLLLQIFTLGGWRPGRALTVGILLVGLPYIVARALGNRATRVLGRRQAAQPHPPGS